ncbi:hypothetical protein I4U23_021555 [Adineta vaga]|nr:hypothetical protein I4U23_021555 [Adineta vaga]
MLSMYCVYPVVTISHFFTLNNIPLSNLLPNNWKMIGLDHGSTHMNETIGRDLFISSHHSKTMCKIRIYFHILSSNISSQILVFASLNRFCMILKKNNRHYPRRFTNFFCSITSAYIICSITCVIWALISLQTIFTFTVKNNYCLPQNFIAWGIKLSTTYFSQTLLMTIFGILTIFYRQKRAVVIRRRCRNHHEMIPMFNQLCQYCRHERSELHHIEVQLTSMIIIEVILVILSSLPYGIYIIYRLSTAEKLRNSTDIIYDSIIERLVQLTIYFEPSCGFYVYLFTLTSLKKRFFKILRRRLNIN